MTSASHQSVGDGPERHWLPSGKGYRKAPPSLFLDLPFHPPTDFSPWGAQPIARLLKGS